MLHANTDIKAIMGMKTNSSTANARLRGHSGQRRFVPKPNLNDARGGASFPGAARKTMGNIDAEGSKLRKDLAHITHKKFKPLDSREDQKLRQQALI